MLLNLIETHAILHQFNRERDDAGRIIANSDDYEVVHNLVAEIISEGLGATVSDAVRETVKVVGQGLQPGDMEAEPMSLSEVTEKLGIDKSSASRRVKQAIKLGYLSNDELIKGKRMRLYIGEPLPEEIQVLPRPEELGFKGKKDVTAVWDLDD